MSISTRTVELVPPGFARLTRFARLTWASVIGHLASAVALFAVVECTPGR